MTDQQKKKISLCEALRLLPGVITVVGGGGKTSLLNALAKELQAQHKKVILGTTTRIYPPDWMPVLLCAGEEQVKSVLRTQDVICVGEAAENGKLAVPQLEIGKLKGLAEYVLLEADGSRGRPLKAHAAHEPVIPPCTDRLLYVLGLSGIGCPIAEAAHRPKLYAARLHTSEGHSVTPEDALQLVDYRCTLVLNQADDEERMAIARQMAAAYGDAVIVCMKDQIWPVKGVWRDRQCWF